MLDFLPGSIKGCLAVALVLVNTLFWFPILLVVALVKLLFPLRQTRGFCTRLLNRIAAIWIANNGRFLQWLNRIQWSVELPENLSRDEWYLVTCNHQSWADIPVVQFALQGHVPLLKFFLKRELIWIPFLGIAWWALDFPFMKRYSKTLLEKRPELRGQDLATTRRACEHFRHTPVAVFNFVEGTRLTPQKHRKQRSPFQHLLRPKAGGVGFVLGAMGEYLHSLLDVTLVYPDGKNGIWDLVCGRIPRVVVHVQRLPIPPQFPGRDYANDDEFRKAFQIWITDRWHRKDQRIAELKQRYGNAESVL